MQEIKEIKGLPLWPSSFLLLLCFCLSCTETQSITTKFSEVHLRERIALAYDHFHKGNFNAFIEMRSDSQRTKIFETESEKIEVMKEWEGFLRREKPEDELISVQIKGRKAIAKMRVTVLTKDGSRREGILYDLWVFENEDWFLDRANRKSPQPFM